MKKIKIIFITLIIVIAAIVGSIFISSLFDDTEAERPEVTTTEPTGAVVTTQPATQATTYVDGYIVVSQNEYGGKYYKFTVK